MASVGSGHSALGANAQGQNDPKKLYCNGCQKEKPTYSFSRTQVTKATHNPYAKGKNLKKHHITCKECTPKQNLTLTCMLCTKTMALEEFAKAQRKNAEKARCRKCMLKREKVDVDDSEADESDEDNDGHYNETWDDIL
ncbi:hypothetical protein G9A89_015432 [Geosiphon pyriformis]|nr:hypothetical protein G9A89_015432 [Geosiphon pyriformis]